MNNNEEVDSKLNIPNFDEDDYTKFDNAMRDYPFFHPDKDIITLLINTFFLRNKLRANGKAKIQLMNEDKKACKKEIKINLKLYLLWKNSFTIPYRGKKIINPRINVKK